MAPNGNGATPQRSWWREPAWITLALAMVAQLLVLGYSLGHLNARVEILMHQSEHLQELLIERSAPGPKR
jgi:hypothetical protein